MAIISGTHLIQFIAIFNIILAYVFLIAPQKFADHDMVFILGAAMGLVASPLFPHFPFTSQFQYIKLI